MEEKELEQESLCLNCSKSTAMRGNTSTSSRGSGALWEQLGASEARSGEKVTQHLPGDIRKLEQPWIIGMDHCCATGNNHSVFQQDGIARILILFLNNLNNLA